MTGFKTWDATSSKNLAYIFSVQLSSMCAGHLRHGGPGEAHHGQAQVDRRGQAGARHGVSQVK